MKIVAGDDSPLRRRTRAKPGSEAPRSLQETGPTTIDPAQFNAGLIDPKIGLGLSTATALEVSLRGGRVIPITVLALRKT